MLQEWWFSPKFTSIFDSATSHLFDRIVERRPAATHAIGKMRDDGMCCLVNKKGKLELIQSTNVLTGPQRIAQLVHCREKGTKRDVFLANSHLSFPGDVDPMVNDERQKREADIILGALSKVRNEWGCKTSSSNQSNNNNDVLQVICGDFNSNSQGLAATYVESPPHNYVNCASATAQQMLSDIGGPVNIGVTHCNHLGERVSVDHIFIRLAKTNDSNENNKNEGNKISSLSPSASLHEVVGFDQSNNNSGNIPIPGQPIKNKDRCAALALGYLDTKGTRIVNVKRHNIVIEGKTVLSDHRPVTARIVWPVINSGSESSDWNETFAKSDLYINATIPLDPLEPAWGIIQ